MAGGGGGGWTAGSRRGLTYWVGEAQGISLGGQSRCGESSAEGWLLVKCVWKGGRGCLDDGGQPDYPVHFRASWLGCSYFKGYSDDLRVAVKVFMFPPSVFWGR